MKATHYTKALNDQGEPDIVMPQGMDSDAILPLPAGWWDTPKVWRTKGDPKGKWVEDLDGERARIWTSTKIGTLAQIDGGITIAGLGTFDSDAAAREMIKRYADIARRNPLLTKAWTLADNSVKTLTAAQLIALDDAITAKINEVVDAKQTLRTKVFDTAKTTIDAVRAVVS